MSFRYYPMGGGSFDLPNFGNHISDEMHNNMAVSYTHLRARNAAYGIQEGAEGFGTDSLKTRSFQPAGGPRIRRIKVSSGIQKEMCIRDRLKPAPSAMMPKVKDTAKYPRQMGIPSFSPFFHWVAFVFMIFRPSILHILPENIFLIHRLGE